MSIEFCTSSVTVPNGKGRRTIAGSAAFASPVVRASVAMNGFMLDYASKDHHINVVRRIGQGRGVGNAAILDFHRPVGKQAFPARSVHQAAHLMVAVL